MKRRISPSFLLLLLAGNVAVATGFRTPAPLEQQVGAFDYARRDEMIPMRDGTKLFTIIMAPKAAPTPLPFMLLRTPYDASADVGNPFPTDYVKALAEDGYIFVFQDVRGLHRSEGQFVMNRPSTGGTGSTRRPTPTTPSSGCSRT
jgi:predicted acyl esterase